MGTVDIIILACFLPAAFFGLKNGFVRQSVALAVIFLGVYIALRFSPAVGQWICDHFSTDQWEIKQFWAKVIAFALIFIAVALVLNLIGKLIDKILKIALLGWLDHLLGLVVSIVTASVVIGLLLYFVDSANELLKFIPEEKIAESHLYKPLLGLVSWVFPYLQQLF